MCAVKTETSQQANLQRSGHHRPDKNTPEFLYRAIFRMHRGLFFKRLQINGIADDTQWNILHIACRCCAGTEPPTQKDIAEELGYSPATITAVIKDMVKNKLVEKCVDQNDMRCNRIIATKKGRELMHEYHETQTSMDTQMYANFSPEEKQQLADYFLRICNNLIDMGARRPRFMNKPEEEVKAHSQPQHGSRSFSEGADS